MATIECRKLSKVLLSGAADARRATPGGFPESSPGPAAFRITDLDLVVPNGKVMVILGPSGCGKSTLLRLVSGLVHPDSGSVLYDGVDAREVPPGKRRIGMVFQNYALYPHLSSRQNILSFFFFRKRTPELDADAERKLRRTSELLGVDMPYLLDRSPRSLSGGERQRVALGRCITRDPALFLLDEPFSNLDQKLREKYRVHLKTLLRQFGITTLYVTHDQQEALLLADLVAIMNAGRIEQTGTPDEVYREPRTLFVADFLGLDPEMVAINLLDGAAVDPAWRGLTAGVRPEDLEAGGPGAGIRGRIVEVRHSPLKRMSVVTAMVGDRRVQLRVSLDETLTAEREIFLAVRRFHLFDPSGRRVRTVPS